MATRTDYRLVLAEARTQLPAPSKREGVRPARRRVEPTLDAPSIAKALRATPGARELIGQIPTLGNALAWSHVATFCVCVKLGTATYLDIWDADHFDNFTDMSHCLAECRAWFSAEGFAYWGAPQTKTGRVNCYFRAPSAGNYVCNVELESYGGPAQVECLIDNFNYGPLPFNGQILQPHPAALSAGYHSFRIRQLQGSFFFMSVTVWRV